MIDETSVGEVKEIIYKHFGEQPLAISGSIRWVAEKEMYKHSFHIVMMQTKYSNHAHMKECLGDFAKIL